MPGETEPDSASYYMKGDFSFEKKFDKIYDLSYTTSDIDPDRCLRFMRKMQKTAIEKGDSLRMAKADFIIGYAYGNKENYVLSLEYYFKALPYAESHHDSLLLVPIYNNVGIAYSKQQQYKKAINYFLKVVAIAEKRRNQLAMGVSYNNVAIEYQNLKQFSTSDRYLKKAFAIFEGVRNEYLSTITMNRGVIRFEKAQYDSALYYYRQGVRYHKKYVSPDPDPNITNNLGELYLRMHRLDSAEYYLKATISLIDTLNDKYSLRETYKHLSDLYNEKGNMQRAYYYLQKHVYLNQVINDNENLKRTLAAEANLKLLKKDNELARQRSEQLYREKQNRFFRMAGLLIGFLLLTALIIAILRFREKKKANEVLKIQKTRIEEQQHEITDSINYASNIQQSILPTSRYLSETLHDYLLFYKPRDIVGGDFYFVERIKNRTYFSVIDCTGHGVPGGFMSILGYNGIQKCLHDFSLVHPADILERLSMLVVQHFTHQGKVALRDGMDMALCCIYEENGTIKLEYAGANNPAWIVKGSTGQLQELTPNKQPIGYYEDRKPFSNTTLTLEKGDTIYLFSDGYADQFGGPAGKKFKYSQLKGLLQINAGNIGMPERGEMLRSAFEEWRSTYEQLDDVCILGVKV